MRYYLLFLLISSPCFAELKVGVSADMSGPAAEFGVATKNGVLLAVAEHPDLFSNVKFFFEDDRYDGKTAITAFNKLRTVNDIDLLYAFGTAPAEAVVPVAERIKFPIIANCISPGVGKGKEYLVRFNSYSKQYTDKLWEYLREKNYKKLAMLVTTSQYYVELLDGLKRGAREGEIVDVVSKHSYDDNNFRTVIAKLKKKDHDAVGAFLFPGQISSYFIQARALHFLKPSFGSDVFESKTELEMSDGALEGAVYVFNWVDPDFVKRYSLVYGNDVQIATAANAYDFAMHVARSLGSKTDKLSGKELLKAFTTLDSATGVSGEYRHKVTEEGGAYFEFPLVLKKIEGGKVVQLAD